MLFCSHPSHIITIVIEPFENCMVNSSIFCIKTVKHVHLRSLTISYRCCNADAILLLFCSHMAGTDEAWRIEEKDRQIVLATKNRQNNFA